MSVLGVNVDILAPKFDFSGHMTNINDVTSALAPPLVGDAVAAPGVSSAFECAFSRDMQAITRLSAVPRSQLLPTSQRHRKPLHFTPLSKMFGDDVMLTVDGQGHVQVMLLERSSEKLAQIASTLLNNSQLITDFRSTAHARDVHHFVRGNVHDALSDARALSLLSDSASVDGVNVSIHRHFSDVTGSDAQQLRHVDFRLQSSHTVFNIRYGTTLAHERERALRHAAARAEEAAWLIERELALSQKLSMYSWSQAQRQQLLTTGRLSSVKTTFYRDIQSYPALADDPKNIRFLPGR